MNYCTTDGKRFCCHAMTHQEWCQYYEPKPADEDGCIDCEYYEEELIKLHPYSAYCLCLHKKAQEEAEKAAANADKVKPKETYIPW